MHKVGKNLSLESPTGKQIKVLILFCFVCFKLGV